MAHNGSSKANGKEALSARQSPPPLAPLHYLQNQRRGSITDPSLHAASNIKLNTGYRPPGDQPSSASSGGSSVGAKPVTEPRPPSPYVFGDATPHISGDSLQIRNLLRSSPSPNTRPPITEATDKPEPPNDTDMDVDGGGRRPFDYSMRRHSIAVGQDKPNQKGTKRKMSTDRSGFAPVGEETDGQLAGPGVPSWMDEEKEPAPKRRGSAVDTARIAALSLNERRHSVDSRGGQQWWLNNDRRDSTSSIFSNSSLGYSSAFSGAESPQPRLPSGIANFAWPTTDPNQTHPQLNMVSPISSFAPDSAPTRILRPRSRPPSRGTPNALEQPTPTPDDLPSAPSPSGSARLKDSGTTPYSRSPELRVSHKLAERKRRKEMKDLFDELRDQLPADRGMKASKWEILSKAIDFVAQLKQSHQDMAREVEMLRHELDMTRQGIPFGPGVPPPHVVYGQPPVPGQFPPPPLGALQHPHPPPLAPPPHAPLSRPPSSQNITSPGAGPHVGPPPNGTVTSRAEPSPT